MDLQQQAVPCAPSSSAGRGLFVAQVALRYTYIDPIPFLPTVAVVCSFVVLLQLCRCLRPLQHRQTQELNFLWMRRIAYVFLVSVVVAAVQFIRYRGFFCCFLLPPATFNVFTYFSFFAFVCCMRMQAVQNLTAEEAASMGSVMASAATTEKKKVHLRKAAGHIWSDPTLDEWSENDHR